MNWLTQHLAFGLQNCGLTYRPLQTKILNIMITVSMETFITKISIHECLWKNFIYDLILNEKHLHRFDNLDPRQSKDPQLMATSKYYLTIVILVTNFVVGGI